MQARLTQTKEQQQLEAKAQAMARIRGRYAEHSAQRDAKRTVVADIPIRTRARLRPMPRAAPANALQSKGQAMLMRARTGGAMQTRRMMLAPRRTPLSRGAASIQGPPRNGAAVSLPPTKRPRNADHPPARSS